MPINAGPAGKPRAERAFRGTHVPQGPEELAAVRGERDDGLTGGEKRDVPLEVRVLRVPRQNRADVRGERGDDVAWGLGAARARCA